MKVEERSFTPEEVADAAEAFITSATTFVTPVVKFNGGSDRRGQTRSCRKAPARTLYRLCLEEFELRSFASTNRQGQPRVNANSMAGSIFEPMAYRKK